MKLCVHSTIEKKVNFYKDNIWGYLLFLSQNNEKQLKEQFCFCMEVQIHEQLSASGFTAEINRSPSSVPSSIWIMFICSGIQTAFRGFWAKGKCCFLTLFTKCLHGGLFFFLVKGIFFPIKMAKFHVES